MPNKTPLSNSKTSNKHFADERSRAFPDRKLGRSWYGWDGDIARHEKILSEGSFLFYALLTALLAVVTVILAAVSWFFASPAHPLLPLCLLSPLFLLTLTGWLLLFTCLAAAGGGKHFSFSFLSKFLTMMVRPLVFLSRPLGLTRDRISSSCIAATNNLSRLRIKNCDNQRPLILLPRCINRDCVAQIRRLAAPSGCTVVMVGTNDQARARIREFKPSSVIAVACERDLVRGLYDYGHQIPILVIANQRPKGPCLDATIEIDQLRRALCALDLKLAPSTDVTVPEDAEPIEETIFTV